MTDHDFYARTSFTVNVLMPSGLVEIWSFPDIETARAVRDELSRLVDGLTSPIAPPG